MEVYIGVFLFNCQEWVILVVGYFLWVLLGDPGPVWLWACGLGNGALLLRGLASVDGVSVLGSGGTGL